MNRPGPFTALWATAIAITPLLILALSGCSGMRNDYPEKTFFRLTPPAIAAVTNADRVRPLLVKQLAIAPEFESDAFVYRTGKNRFRSDFYHSFLTPPARMISDLIKESLYTSKRFTPPGPPADIRYQLWGKIIDLYADLTGDRPYHAVICLRLILDADTGDGFATVTRKVYTQKIAFNTLDPDLYIDSLNQGLTLILEKFYADIKDDIK